MSKGMWTKCLTPDGRPFYYNAVHNQSLWQPPAEAVTHEAANLKIPEVASSNVNLESSDQFLSEVLALNGVVEPVYTNENPFAIANPVSSSSSLPSTAPVDPETLKNDVMAFDLQAKIDQALLQKQRETAARRFSKKATTQAGPDAFDSEYSKQKSEFEALSGMKSDEGSKWLVR